MTSTKKKPKRQRALFTVRLHSEVCEACDHNCNATKLIRCPVCHAMFDSKTEIDLWEVYDDYAICPACERVVPGYECFVICPREMP